MKKIDRIIKESVNRFLLREYLDKDYMMPLKKNLEMDESDKYFQNVYDNIDMACNYLGIYYDDIYKKIEKGLEADEKNGNDKNRLKWTKYLFKKYPEQLKRYCNDRSNLYAEDFPSNLMFQDATVFKNNWVVHFTNNPYSILKHGFRGLSSENYVIKRLWRTYKDCGLDDERINGEGFCFAYDINDEPNTDYGDYGLIFRTSGLKVRNKIDGDYQVIFNGRQANMKDCLLMHVVKETYMNGSPYDDNSSLRHNDTFEIIDPISNRVIYKNTDYEKAVHWAVDNYRQYSGLNTFKGKNMKFIQNQKKDAIAKVQPIISYIKNNAEYWVDITNYQKDYFGDGETTPNNINFTLKHASYNYITQGFKHHFNWRKMKDDLGLKDTRNPENGNVIFYNDDVSIEFNPIYHLDYLDSELFKEKYGEHILDNDDNLENYYLYIYINCNYKQ